MLPYRPWEDWALLKLLCSSIFLQKKKKRKIEAGRGEVLGHLSKDSGDSQAELLASSSFYLLLFFFDLLYLPFTQGRKCCLVARAEELEFWALCSLVRQWSLQTSRAGG